MKYVKIVSAPESFLLQNHVRSSFLDNTFWPIKEGVILKKSKNMRCSTMQFPLKEHSDFFLSLQTLAEQHTASYNCVVF